MRHRREVGRVGFHQHAIERYGANDLAQRRGAAEGDDPGERDHEVHLHRRAGHLQAFREAMHHAGVHRIGMCGEQAQRVLARIARMHDDREPRPRRRLQMRDEALLLALGVLRAMVVIEPGFTDRDHLGLRGEREQLGDADRLRGTGRGMNADRCKDLLVRLRVGEHARLVLAVDRHREHAPYPGGRGSLQDGVDVHAHVGRREVVQMTMAVYEHAPTARRPLLTSCAWDVRIPGRPRGRSRSCGLPCRPDR
jgi:hypothetical protein